MRFFTYLSLYLLIALLVLQNQLLLAMLAVCLFTYYTNAAWLILLGFLIDGYFGSFTATPMFTIVSILWYIVSEFAKPRLNLRATSL
ncbi:MAG: hypothetical protein AAB618_01110 [Patescibacteria group bacterium]